jgi:hypothetical protein
MFQLTLGSHPPTSSAVFASAVTTNVVTNEAKTASISVASRVATPEP